MNDDRENNISLLCELDHSTVLNIIESFRDTVCTYFFTDKISP